MCIGRYLPRCGQSTKWQEAKISKLFAVTAVLQQYYFLNYGNSLKEAKSLIYFSKLLN